MMVRLARAHERADFESWLETEAGRLHVRAAYNLLGGNPRVVAMVFRHLDPENLDDLHGNFFGLAEEVTPYYQEQMERLSPGQRSGDHLHGAGVATHQREGRGRGERAGGDGGTV